MQNIDKKLTCHSELVSESHNKVDSQQEKLDCHAALAMTRKTKAPLVKGGKRRGDYYSELSIKGNPTTAKAVPLPFTREVKKVAFTLAEVLITLGIIGVVAAMTMPSLIQKHQERVTVNKVKKFYSVMSQAQLMAIKDNGYLNDWDVPDGQSKESAEKFMSYFKPYLKIAKDCGTDSGCLQNGNIKLLNGNDWTNYDTNSSYYKLILNDGTYMWFRTAGSTYCHTSEGSIADTCGALWVDVNGKNPPNTIGKDIFVFFFTKNNIKTVEIDDCNSSGEGWSCAGYILEQGNMDYLKQ